MVSQSEVAVVKANGSSAASRTRSKSASNSNKTSMKTRSSKRSPKAPTGTDIVPVMKMKAIEIVDKEESGNKDIAPFSEDRGIEMPPVLHMPAPRVDAEAIEQAGENLVTDPELLELLKQLSETIDTANTVLNVAASEVESNAAKPQLNGDDSEDGYPEPAVEPEPSGDDDNDDAPHIAAREAPLGADQNQPPPRRKFGFGLVANSALTGLILAAGAAWILHTNPWLVNELHGRVQHTFIGAAILPAETPVAGNGKISLNPITPAQTANENPSPAAAVPPIKRAAPGVVTASLGPTNADPVPLKPEPYGQPQAQTLEMISSPVFAGPGEAAVLDMAIDTGPGSLETSIMVQGLPASMKLSAGKDLGSGNWLLKTEELSGLQIHVGRKTAAGTYGAEFIAVKNDGSVPETQKVSIIVAGAALPPDSAKAKPAKAEAKVAARQTAVARQAPQSEPQGAPSTEDTAKASPAPLSPAETKALLARGTALLNGGEVTGARLLLDYAAQRGSKDAMVMLAQSFDPDFLSKLPVLGVQPNAEVAAKWYDRAAQAAQ